MKTYDIYLKGDDTSYPARREIKAESLEDAIKKFKNQYPTLAEDVLGVRWILT